MDGQTKNTIRITNISTLKGGLKMKTDSEITEREKELLIFVLGVMLGIIGNLFSDFYIAWSFPEGVPEDIAFRNMLIFSAGLISYVIIFAVIIFKPKKRSRKKRD